MSIEATTGAVHAGSTPGRRRRRRRMGALALSLVMILAACGSDDGSDDEDPSTTAAAGSDTTAAAAAGECEELTPVKIAVINVPPKFAYSTPVFADVLGYYELFCLDAEVIGFSGGIQAVRATQAGEADIGFGPTTSLISVVAGGSDLVGFFSPASLLPQQVVVTEGIDTCEDLAGQTVATGGPGDLVHFLMTMYLDSCGLVIGEDVEVLIGDAVDLGPYLADGLAQGSATHPEESAILFNEVGVQLNSLGGVAEIAPDFHYLSLFGFRDYLEDPANRDTAARAAAAMIATNRFLTDPANEETVVELAKETIIAGDTEGVAELGYERYGSLFPTTCAEALDPARYEWTINWAFEAEEIEEAMPVDTLIDQSICADAEALVDGTEDLSPPGL